MKQLEIMREELKEMADREAIRLWRMARNAQKHGCSNELVNEIREEGSYLYNTIKYYPDRLLDWKFEYTTKYAFR